MTSENINICDCVVEKAIIVNYLYCYAVLDPVYGSGQTLQCSGAF